jgi:hypothetical protein
MHGLATLLGERESGLCQVGDGMIDDVCTVVTNLLLSNLKSAHVEEETTASRSNK